MTTAVYGVKVIGLKELQRRLEQYPKLSRSVLKPAITSMVVRLETEVKKETPVHLGSLKKSINQRVIPVGNNVQGIVGTWVSYAPVMEHGAKPFWAPIKPLKRWAHLKLGDEKHAYWVRGAIHKRGIKARKMFAKGLRASESFIHTRFVRARDEIVRKLAGG